MKIAPHSVTLTTPTRVPAQSPSAQAGSAIAGRTTKAVNPFAALVTSRIPAASSGEGVAVEAAVTPSTAKTTTVNPLAAWVTCVAPSANPSNSTAATAAAATEVAPVNPLASLVTATPAVTAASTPSSTPVATPAQPGIGALIGAIMDGSFQPTYLSPSQLVENTPYGAIDDSPAYYASDQTAQQLATLLGGKVVQQVPFASSTATSTEPKANFIQLPSGQTVNAADLAYYAKCGGCGVQQLAADLTQEINQGGAITSYNDQMLAFLNGSGTFPSEMPMFQAGVIGPPIAGMTYPPGTLAADGSVINPDAPSGIGT